MNYRERETVHPIRGMRDEDGTIVVRAGDLADAVLGNDGPDSAIPLLKFIQANADLLAKIEEELPDE